MSDLSAFFATSGYICFTDLSAFFATSGYICFTVIDDLFPDGYFPSEACEVANWRHIDRQLSPGVSEIRQFRVRLPNRFV
jgi:hypothetical protein